MANLTRNFTGGKMNKALDERLVPNGEYIDALNCRMGSSEGSEIGVIENCVGNTHLTEIRYPNGAPLSIYARAIGSYADGSNEKLYWFVHDPACPLTPTGKYDAILSLDTNSGMVNYHVVSMNDGGGVNTTLNFNADYLITGVNLVDNLLFFVEENNAPRKINIKRKYALPDATYIDQFSAEAILVIKKPPVSAPAISPIRTGIGDTFMDTRFVCFAYRYRYEDGEYSAISQFSAPCFIPKPFEFNADTYLNGGMKNLTNTAIITYDTGGPLVKGIDLLFKEPDSNIIKVIEKLDKKVLGLQDNEKKTYTFTNSKIFTILPDSEILRLYDNVPLFANAQTVMGNRIVYGAYKEGYDMNDQSGNAVKLDYKAELVSEEIGETALGDSLGTGTYAINTAKTVPNSVINIDMTGANLKEGSSIIVDIRLTHGDFSGGTAPTEETASLDIVFSFLLPKDYTSVYQLATSKEFIDAVGNSSPLNFQPILDSCIGNTLTDQLNCALPNTLGIYTKYKSGISADDEPIKIITSPSSQIIGLQMIAMRYVDNVTTPTVSAYEYYAGTLVTAVSQDTATSRSLHSNRGYEVGIIYMDEFLRSSTALVSPMNTIHIPCSKCDSKNSLKITIPSTQKAPEWATRYKFAIKADKEGYDTIYSNIFFKDPSSNATYFLLEGENARKIETGDRLIVKADTSGSANSCVFCTVLEKEAKNENFIDLPSIKDPTVKIYVPSGVYMKINANNFSTQKDEFSVINEYGSITVNEDDAGHYPILLYPFGIPNATRAHFDDFTIPAGSRIKLSFKFERKGIGQSGDHQCERRVYTLEKNLVASKEYTDVREWFIGDNIKDFIDDGIQDVGEGGGIIKNVFDPILASYGGPPPPTSQDTNHWRFNRNPTTNILYLEVTGAERCGGVCVSGQCKERRRSSITANIIIIRSGSTLVFETEPSDALPDVFFESDECFDINVNGEHQGNVSNQTSLLPAIIDTSFFNCYTFGNGVESYKMLDSVKGKPITLGNRVTTTTSQDFKRAKRFADITWSGVYNDESNINKFNEFNLGLVNFKPLEDSFGPIQILDGRETDILVLQEDKISYVLAGKNLLSDAGAGSTIMAVPDVFGIQLARVEEYGISSNPESYVSWGYDKFFTDSKRGAVIQLRGGSANSDKINIISELGMRPWFRDLFNNSFRTQKLGGFDPYMNEYVLANNDIKLPSYNEAIECGTALTFRLIEGEQTKYIVALGNITGDVTVTYNILSAAPIVSIEAKYNGVVVSSLHANFLGVLTVNKNTVGINELEITAMSDKGESFVEIIVSCPVRIPLTVVDICLASYEDRYKYIHNQYRYVDGAFASPLQSNMVFIPPSTASPLVARYVVSEGFQGEGAFPSEGSTVSLISNKVDFDSIVFDTLTDRFAYYLSDFLLSNTSEDIQFILANAIEATPNEMVSINEYHAHFTLTGAKKYMYLIWDYRKPSSISLCYSAISAEAACDCSIATPINLCYSATSSTDACGCI